MQVLDNWTTENKNSNGSSAEYAVAVKGFLKAIESHVVDNSDGYSINTGRDPEPTSDQEKDALRNAQTAV